MPVDEFLGIQPSERLDWIKDALDPVFCSFCRGDGVRYRECPYANEIYNVATVCNCCDDCHDECLRDI